MVTHQRVSIRRNTKLKMKKIEISNYIIAIVVVGKTLHITITIVNKHEISLKDFNNDKEVSLCIFNQFTEAFATLPTEWNARMLTCHPDKIILILK